MIHRDLGIYFGDKQNPGDYDNGVWMHLLDIPFLKNIEEAQYFKVIIRTLWIEATGWSKTIRDQWPHVKQIGLSDHPLSAHISKLSAENAVKYVNDLHSLDGIMALTEEEQQWYSVAVPSKPVIYAGLPFPFESYEERFGHLRGQEKKFIGLGVGASDNDRNFISSLLVFRRLQLENPDIVGVFLSIPKNQVSNIAPYADAVQNVYIHERENMEAFYEMISQCKFIINMSDRNTPGRIEAESAFFHVPVVGSDRLELQTKLYPDLSMSPYRLSDAVAASQSLLDSSPEHLEEIGAKAEARLQQFNYARSREKFADLLDKIGVTNLEYHKT